MKNLTLRDIVQVLRDYRAEFGFLDVLASDVEEIAAEKPIFTTTAPDHFRTQVDGTTLELQMFREKQVARFNLAPDASGVLGGVVAGAAAGGLLGGVADAEDRRQAPAGLIFGLLLGGILGGALGASATPRPPRQVLTLRYDPAEATWRIYHGPYLKWAKEAVRAEW